MSDFEPRILGILCNWCSYAGADLAGVSRIQYPPNLRIVRVMCSGRVDPVLVMDALIKGVDGVFVLGCHPGDCHYISGNKFAEQRMKLLSYALSNTSMGDERVRLDWVSASEGTRFGEVITEFTEKIRKLGPNPMRDDKERKSKLATELTAVRNLMASQRIRTLLGKQSDITELDGNVYGIKIKKPEYKEMMTDSVHDEYMRNCILLASTGEPRTVKELSEFTGEETWDVLKHIVVLRKKNLMALSGIDGTTPKYISIARGCE